MQFRDGHANEHTALKRLGGDFTGRKKGRRCSLDRISKVYHYRHQKTKLKINFIFIYVFPIIKTLKRLRMNVFIRVGRRHQR